MIAISAASGLPSVQLERWPEGIFYPQKYTEIVKLASKTDAFHYFLRKTWPLQLSGDMMPPMRWLTNLTVAHFLTVPPFKKQVGIRGRLALGYLQVDCVNGL